MAGDLVGQAPHLRRRGVVLGEQLARARQSRPRTSSACGVNERIALEVLVYLGWGAVADLGVGAGVSQEANAPQVQEGRAARALRTYSTAASAAS